MKSKIRRFISLMVCAILLFGMLPTNVPSVFAAEQTETSETQGTEGAAEAVTPTSEATGSSETTEQTKTPFEQVSQIWMRASFLRLLYQ